jgi:hypothetical protein
MLTTQTQIGLSDVNPSCSRLEAHPAVHPRSERPVGPGSDKGDDPPDLLRTRIFSISRIDELPPGR